MPVGHGALSCRADRRPPPPSQGCYVSLLHPNSLGKTPSAALQQVIKDFAGLDSPGADTQVGSPEGLLHVIPETTPL